MYSNVPSLRHEELWLWRTWTYLPSKIQKKGGCSFGILGILNSAQPTRWDFETSDPQSRYTLIVWVFNPPTSTLAADWQLGCWKSFGKMSTTITGQKSWAWNFTVDLLRFFLQSVATFETFPGARWPTKKQMSGSLGELIRSDVFRLNQTLLWMRQRCGVIHL